MPPYLSGPASLDVTQSMPALEVVQLPTAGFDGVLERVPPEVTVCNARGVHDSATAELAVALAIAGRRGFAEFGRAAAEHRWADGRFPGLADSRVAIVGYGSIGQAIHRRLAGFEVDVTGFSRTGSNGSEPVASLPDLIGQFDVVVVVAPLTEETRGLVDAELLARMRDGALLVNVARGPLVDTDALVAELRSGRLRAALDVVDPEPLPPDHPLWDLSGCLLTPHVGGNTGAFEPRIRRLVAEQLAAHAAGEPLRNVVGGPLERAS